MVDPDFRLLGCYSFAAVPRIKAMKKSSIKVESMGVDSGWVQVADGAGLGC